MQLKNTTAKYAPST